nr:2819_t:CDS:2 [Entrophospora candida]
MSLGSLQVLNFSKDKADAEKAEIEARRAKVLAELDIRKAVAEVDKAETDLGKGASIEYDNSSNDSSDSFQATVPLLPSKSNYCGSSDDKKRYQMEKSSKHSARKLWIAIVIACLFFTIELIGGWIAGSLALLSDSFHLLSGRLKTFTLQYEPLSYGYHRAEILGALISIIIIWLLTGWLCVEAYYRIQFPTPVDGKTMSFVAAIGVVVNIVLILILGHEHHGNDDAHHKHHHCGDNVNVRAALLHVLGDLLSSLGVLISSIVIIFDETKVWDFDGRMDLEAIDGVKSVHDLHIWDLTVGRTTLTAHLCREYKTDSQAEASSNSSILTKALNMLNDKYHISQVTIQIDP